MFLNSTSVLSLILHMNRCLLKKYDNDHNLPKKVQIMTSRSNKNKKKKPKLLIGFLNNFRFSSYRVL